MMVPASLAASTDSNDLIVRFRAPQNTKAETKAALSRLAVAPQAAVEVINSEEGVVRLAFSSPEEARASRERLERSGDVLRVAPNLWYQPAIHYSFDEVAEEQEEALSFPGLPLSPWSLGPTRGLKATLPEVQLPRASTPGVDPLEARDWAMRAIRLHGAVARLQASASVVTAVIDTGVDYNHEDLVNAMWRKPGRPREVGYDFAHGHAKPFDVVHFDLQGCANDATCSRGLDTTRFLVNPGHGTHCAGHVGAVYRNSLGIRGVGAGTPIMALKFFRDHGETNAGRGDDAAAIRSIDYAIKNGARVISASWGGRVDRDRAQSSELREALVRARNAGVLVVVAAGNDGIDQDAEERPVYPAAYSTELDNLIVVAATDESDRLAKFSNYGSESVHLGAPGVKILSTTAGSAYSDVVARFRDRDGRERSVNWDGTSMATPIVAGAAALLWSQNPGATYHEIRDRILRSVRNVPALGGKVSTAGVLDMAALLQ